MYVFARAGCQTRIYDRDPKQLNRALDWLEQDLKLDRKEGFLRAVEASALRARISVHTDISEALRGAGYVQESGPEDVALKQALYSALDGAADPNTILASSTSGLNISEISANLAGAHRCIVAHPVNPPHVIPVVEVLGGSQTDTKVVTRTCAFLSSVGQRPVLMKSYVPGFLLNRMQAALLREAIQLVDRGIADVDAVDTTIREGLGLRWAVMGPFGVAETNADGGVREYYTRYRQSYIEFMNDLAPTPSFDDDTIERLARGVDAMMGRVSRARVRRWRDRMVRRIRAIKHADPRP
jgi:3-hydroxyacyl-CoA dehydrogenase